MIQDLHTVIYRVGDLAGSKAWYDQLLGCKPYIDRPFYVGYAVGGFELGLIPESAGTSQGALAYWGVPDAEAELARLKDLGADIHDPLKDVGEGIKMAAIRDPLGNLFGIIETPHFKPQNLG